MAVKFNAWPICNGRCNYVYKLNVNLYLARQTSLQLSQFVLDYATVYISLIVNLYLAWQTSLHA